MGPIKDCKKKPDKPERNFDTVPIMKYNKISEWTKKWTNIHTPKIDYSINRY